MYIGGIKRTHSTHSWFDNGASYIASLPFPTQMCLRQSHLLPLKVWNCCDRRRRGDCKTLWSRSPLATHSSRALPPSSSSWVPSHPLSHPALLYQVYVRKNVSSNHSKLIGPWLQLVAFLLAAIASLSRISDHRHHPVDVLAGAIVGVGVGLLTAISILSKRSSETEEEEEGKKREDLRSREVAVGVGGGSLRKEKAKRPSQMRLINSEFGWDHNCCCCLKTLNLFGSRFLYRHQSYRNQMVPLKFSIYKARVFPRHLSWSLRSVVETERGLREEEANPTFWTTPTSLRITINVFALNSFSLLV